jgi:protein-tyrosine phosphatase
MIDIHCHILPGMDDGPDHIEETLDMFRLSQEDGIQGIVATPHLYSGLFTTTREGILRCYEEVLEALETEKINVKLYIGADLHLVPELTRKIIENHALTLNHGKYFLLELPSRVLPPNLNKLIEDLILHGFIPIITHPERNLVILRNEQILIDMIHLGALCQVTAMSVTGEFGKECEYLSRRLLEAHAVHFIASDAHSTGWRGPGLSRAAKVAEDLIGEESARRLVQGHQEVLLAGGVIEPAPVRKLSKRKRFWFF